MGTEPGARSYREQQLHNAASQARDDAALWASATADKLLELTNAKPCTPSKDEVVQVLLRSLGK